MKLLQRTLIEKAGHDNGFEHVLPAAAVGWLALGSARHPAQLAVRPTDAGFQASLSRCQPSLPDELARSFAEAVPAGAPEGPYFLLPTEGALARWLRRAVALAQALPDQAMAGFDAQVKVALAELEPAAAKNTEVQRLVRQRVGQQAFRQAMLDYWGGACAVTGVALPQALRASHAKAWALCDIDAERLDVYNGFLLSANLDALFDACLASFGADGSLLLSPEVPAAAQAQLGLTPGHRLRWLHERHGPYLAFHQAQCKWLADGD